MNVLFVMTDAVLETNSLYKFLHDKHIDKLSEHGEPLWLVCIPVEDSLKDIDFTLEFAKCHILKKCNDSSIYTSKLLEDTIYYEVIGNENRSIVWNLEGESEVVVSKAHIINEYLIPVKETVIHVALISRRLVSMIEDDYKYLCNNYTISSSKDATYFLKSFTCHIRILKDILVSVEHAKHTVLPHSDIDTMQCCLHGIMLQYWGHLIKLHISKLQTDTDFQDLLFKALEFFVVDHCHEELFNQIKSRCFNVDRIVNKHLCKLRAIDLSPVHLGLPDGLFSSFPGTISELSSISTCRSAIGRLHRIRDAIDLIEAHTKETWAYLRQYQDYDTEVWDIKLTEHEVVSLLVIGLVKAQCYFVVSNIYYFTHFVFSVPHESDPLWQCVYFLRKALQTLMDLDVKSLLSDVKMSRKELSLQDLMKVSPDIENKLNQRLAESKSIPNFMSADLQMREVSRRLQNSAQALLDGTIDGSESPRTPQRRKSFIEFLSNIPSSIRESFRRKQKEQKSIFETNAEKPFPCSIRL